MYVLYTPLSKDAIESVTLTMQTCLHLCVSWLTAVTIQNQVHKNAHLFKLKHIYLVKIKKIASCCHHGRAIARVHPVHLMNVEWRQAAANPTPSQMT